MGYSFPERGTVPVGGLSSWLKDFPNCPPLPDYWHECDGSVLSDPESPFDGQTLPDLNNTNLFLRGSLVSGGTGGAATHTHTYTNNTGLSSTALNAGLEVGSTVAAYSHKCADHLHLSSGTTANANSAPPYYGVVWVMRVK